jgi:hypothetical protein
MINAAHLRDAILGITVLGTIALVCAAAATGCGSSSSNAGGADSGVEGGADSGVEGGGVIDASPPSAPCAEPADGVPGGCLSNGEPLVASQTDRCRFLPPDDAGAAFAFSGCVIENPDQTVSYSALTISLPAFGATGTFSVGGDPATQAVLVLELASTTLSRNVYRGNGGTVACRRVAVASSTFLDCEVTKATFDKSSGTAAYGEASGWLHISVAP